MLMPLSIEKRKELQPHVNFVGVGSWPNVTTFALGLPTRPAYIAERVLSTHMLATEAKRIYALAPAHWTEIFFVSLQGSRMQVTKEDAIWFLNNMSH
jgi:hypothetical protein